MIDYMGVHTSDRTDICRAVRENDCSLPSTSVLRVSRALEHRIKLRVELRAEDRVKLRGEPRVEHLSRAFE